MAKPKVSSPESEQGPWNPGLTSSIPEHLMPHSTLFRDDCGSVSYHQAKEIADFCGLSVTDVAAFLPERLLVHELLVRVTADLMVPDGPEYEELGINLRSMATRIYDRHVVPEIRRLKRMHSEVIKEAKERLTILVNELRSPPVLHKPAKPSFFKWVLGIGLDKPEDIALPQVSDAVRLEILASQSGEDQGSLDQACRQALYHVCQSIIRTRGRLVGDSEAIVKICCDRVANSYGSSLLGDALDPIIQTAVSIENYRYLPSQTKPVVMNVKGASASGKSTIRPRQRMLAESLKVPWSDFALISPDYWRKYLLDYATLGKDHKYGAMLTGHELAIIDQKLDRYMAQKAQAGTMPHLLIDRFRFDSFSVEADRGNTGKLLTRFGNLVFMFFMITPPPATVERAWKRGLSTGRYKAVDDLLDHNIEAYEGMPELYFSWAKSASRKVHTEFLDNSVPFGKPPKTVAYGWNGELTILDIAGLINIERYRKVDVDAESADSVFAGADMAAASNLGFLQRCVSELDAVNFVDPISCRIFGRIEKGEWVWRGNVFGKKHEFGEEERAGLDALGYFDEILSNAEAEPAGIEVHALNTLGAWPA